MLTLDKSFTRFRDDKNGMLVFSMLVGFGLSIFFIGKLIFSDFSVLDDHTIAAWLGAQRHVGWKDLWPMVSSTELGQYGSGPRFRPVMYMLIIFQTMLWGAHPAGFHVLAILWFSIFLWSVAWVSFRSIGIVPGCVILFIIANGHYWGNIFTHSTFVSEQPAAMGLGIAIFGFGLLFSWFVDGARSKIDTAVLLVGVGSLIALGSKENFMALAGLNILLVLATWRARRIELRTLIISIFIILLSLAICYGIVVPNLGKPTDMYGFDNSVGYRLRMIRHSSLIWRVMLALAGSVAALVLGRRGMARSDVRDARAMLAFGVVLGVAGLYLTWEIFFYAGRLPAGQRYDFPALLIDPLLAGSAYYAASRTRAVNPWFRERFSPLALQVCFVLLFLSVASAYFARGRLFPIIPAIQISNAHTNLMRDDLTRGMLLAARHPDWPIIVNPSYPLDYEAVVTFPIWLKFFQVPNPASIFVSVPPQNITSPFEKSLVDAMQSQSRDGRAGMYVARNAAIEKAQMEGHCYIIVFDNHNTSCTPLPYRPSGYYPVD